jgi:predicted nuclease of predicted toxin-antitoxin system
MKFIIDAALSPAVARLLAEAGHDAIHVWTYDMAKASDTDIFTRAGIEDRVIISVDTDFSALIATRNTTKPSLILIRWPMLRLPSSQAKVILANLPNFAEDLEKGAIVTIEEGRVRVRPLPIHKSNA